MKNVAYEIGMFLISVVPFAIISKNGEGKVSISFARIAEVLLGAAIIGLVVGYLSTAIITSNLSIEIEHLQEMIIEVKERIKSFHGG